jgi:hypothetical protein
LQHIVFAFRQPLKPNKKAKNKELHPRNKDKKQCRKKQPGAKLHNVAL